MNDAPYTTSEAARVLGLSAQTVRLYVDSGRLPAIRTATGWRLIDRPATLRLARELVAARRVEILGHVENA